MGAADEEAKTWKGHVVMMPWPALGHINPMMHLANRLAAHGVLVTFLNTQFNHDRILQTRHTSSPQTQTCYPEGNCIRLVGIQDGLDYDEYIANLNAEKQGQALIDLQPLLVKLVEEAQPPVTCIIADAFVIATPAVARRFDIPHVTFWTQNAASYASHLFFTQNHASLKEYLEELHSEGKVDERVISCVPSCPKQVIEFAVGLETSGWPFLMVVRPKMMEGGASIAFPDGFVDKMRDSGQAVFVEWAPQLEVLAHPAIGGFLTHAGWNSTLESICRGVPMLCWPYFADQMLNSRCIVDVWKIGLDFIMEKVSYNEEWRNSSCGNNDSNNGTSNKARNNEHVALVKCEEIKNKIRQLMDPLTSMEIRKQINSLSLATKRAYGSSSCSNFQSLLDVISS